MQVAEEEKGPCGQGMPGNSLEAELGGLGWQGFKMGQG